MEIFEEEVGEDDELSHEDGQREFFGLAGGEGQSVNREFQFPWR